jgi:DNA-binding NtrC family response regulator
MSSTTKKNILLVDDDPKDQQKIISLFRNEPYDFTTVSTIDELAAEIQNEEADYDLVILDLQLDKMEGLSSGLNMIDPIREAWPYVNVIAITNDIAEKTEKAALTKGAEYFFQKFNPDSRKWTEQIEEAIAAGREKKKLNNKSKKTESLLIGESQAMNDLRRDLEAVAKRPSTAVVLTGETGVGKTLAARYMHEHSGERSKKAFEEVLVANLPKATIYSELFGHTKGSFTGADSNKMGRLQLANGGTVFLDEIADLDLESQTQLIQFLNSRVIRPLGSEKDIKLDVLIIAATNKNLEVEVKKGNFREDLYYRLNNFPVWIPPLRERREDILPLMCHFAKLGERELKSAFISELWDYFLHRCPWYGNTRQLRSVLETAFLHKSIRDLAKIDHSCIPKNLDIPLTGGDQVIQAPFTVQTPKVVAVAAPTPEIDRELSPGEQIAIQILSDIEKALEETKGKKALAAEKAGYESDDNMRYKLKTILKDYPNIATSFPWIRKKYYTLIQQSNPKP